MEKSTIAQDTFTRTWTTRTGSSQESCTVIIVKWPEPIWLHLAEFRIKFERGLFFADDWNLDIKFDMLNRVVVFFPCGWNFWISSFGSHWWLFLYFLHLWQFLLLFGSNLFYLLFWFYLHRRLKYSRRLTDNLRFLSLLFLFLTFIIRYERLYNTAFILATNNFQSYFTLAIFSTKFSNTSIVLLSKLLKLRFSLCKINLNKASDVSCILLIKYLLILDRYCLTTILTEHLALHFEFSMYCSSVPPFYSICAGIFELSSRNDFLRHCQFWIFKLNYLPFSSLAISDHLLPYFLWA